MEIKQSAIFPGTFDPITNGHLNLITRAAALFSHLIVAIALSPNKKTLFSLDERVSLAKVALKNLTHVDVIAYDNLMANFASQHQAKVLVRGVRTTSDFEYEKQLAQANKNQNPALDTIFLLPSPEISFISSTLVKEIAFHSGEIHSLVPKNIEVALLSKIKKTND